MKLMNINYILINQGKDNHNNNNYINFMIKAQIN